MPKKFLITFFLFSIFPLVAFSQSTNAHRPYLLLSAGGFVSGSENFSDVYDSRLGFIFGGGIGIPLSSKLYLIGRVNYFQKSGTPKTWNYTIDLNRNVSSELMPGNGSAEYTQWIVNGGFEHIIPLSEEFNLYPMAGISYSTVSENIKDTDGENVSSAKYSGLFGFFVGAGISKNITNLNLSVFAEGSYNVINQSMLSHTMHMGGTNIDVGLRYYLKFKNDQ